MTLRRKKMKKSIINWPITFLLRGAQAEIKMFLPEKMSLQAFLFPNSNPIQAVNFRKVSNQSSPISKRKINREKVYLDKMMMMSHLFPLKNSERLSQY
jgi:hypothetical protein